ncbi:MAG: phospholipid/glycerol acyltransferase [Thermoleophilia bacterium]|nr:phospholipid/glycerol acyltransferase [Thermoleophilia bacterium]
MPTTTDIPTKRSTTTCLGQTQSGARCRRRAAEGSKYCALHADQAPPELPADIDRDELADAIADFGTEAPEASDKNANGPIDELLEFADLIGDNVSRITDAVASSGLVDDSRVERFVADFLLALTSLVTAITERASGDYEEDEFGFDQRFTERLVPLMDLLFRYYWRVDVDGIENVPAEGPGLLVSNHAGAGIPFDGAMIKTAVLQQHSNPRHVRLLVLDWLMGLPYLGDLMRQTGQVLASSPNAYELLKRDQLIAVFPEGVRGMAKPFSQRYQLQRFGRGGFVRIALRTRTPIVPVAVVGSEEIYPKLGNLPVINKLIGAPFVPMTPLFPWFGLAGAIPLPSKWHIEFCEPIDVSQYPVEAADDRALVLELSERVRATIQERLKANLLKRKTPFW